MKKYIKTISNYALVGSLGAFLLTGLTGCEDKNNNETAPAQPQQQGAFVVIEEVEKGKYQVKEEFPAQETKILLKDINGTERVLSKEEMDKLIKEEEAKIDNNTSNLTQSHMSSGGMGLGEAILASAAGAIIGSWIGSKLFGNANYQNNRQAGYRNPSTYSRSVNNFNKPKPTAPKKSGFFSKTSGSKGFFGG